MWPWQDVCGGAVGLSWPSLHTCTGYTQQPSLFQNGASNVKYYIWTVDCMSVFKSHSVSRRQDGVVSLWFQRLQLAFAVAKEQWQLPLVWHAHLLLNFSRTSSGIRAQLADGVGEPFLEGGDRVPWTSRWRVWAGAGAARGLVGHRAHWWGDAAVTASRRVRLCCWDREKRETYWVKLQQLIVGCILPDQLLQTDFFAK